MTNSSYSVSESIHRRNGRIMKIIYDYEEKQELVELNLLTHTQDHTQQYRRYQATIKRDEYERIIHIYMFDKDSLPFDSFVRILRPIMMGTYVGNELREAFNLLDKNRSGRIDIDELAIFLPIIHSDVTKESLLHYVGKVNVNTDQKLNFDEFTALILRGIGKDIVCGHI